MSHAIPPATPADLFARFEELGIETSTTEHDPVFTVAESHDLKGHLPGGHSKNLFLKDKKGRIFLVVAEAEARIDLKHLHQTIGATGRLSFGSAELLGEVLGVEPGSVTPFGIVNDHDNRVSVVLDAGLMRHARVNFHPLVNSATTGLAAADLVTFLTASAHPPRILALPEPPEAAGEERPPAPS